MFGRAMTPTIRTRPERSCRVFTRDLGCWLWVARLSALMLRTQVWATPPILWMTERGLNVIIMNIEGLTVREIHGTNYLGRL